MDASTQLRLAYLAVGSAILFFWEGQELVSVGPCRGQNVEHRRCQDSRDGRLLASHHGRTHYDSRVTGGKTKKVPNEADPRKPNRRPSS